LPRRVSRRASLVAGVILLASPWATASDATLALTTVNPASAYPEGPTVVDGVLYYAEMGNDRVMRFDGVANSPVWTRDGCGPTTVVAVADAALAVLCHREEIVARISADGALLGIVDRDRDGRAFSNPNAGVSDGKGGIYFSSSGTFSPGARATGAILHLDASGTLTRVAEDIHYANGVALTRDGSTLYASEHLDRRVLAFDVAEDGTLSNRRTFVALDDLVGADPARGWEVGPDGLNLDRDGNLIVAEYGAGRLLVVDRDGKLVTTIPVPERYVTASAFDAGQTRLFITAPASLMDPSLGAVYATPYPIAAPP
jgi:sugar lactone lactonase YvrE